MDNNRYSWSDDDLELLTIKEIEEIFEIQMNHISFPPIMPIIPPLSEERHKEIMELFSSRDFSQTIILEGETNLELIQPFHMDEERE